MNRSKNFKFTHNSQLQTLGKTILKEMKVKGRIKVKQTSRQKESIRQKKSHGVTPVTCRHRCCKNQWGVLVRLSIAVRSHNDHGNSYKE